MGLKNRIENNTNEIKKVNEKLEHTVWLQKALRENGFDLAIDGYFGQDTMSKVKEYQAKNNLEVDGMVGLETHTYLINSK